MTSKLQRNKRFGKACFAAAFATGLSFLCTALNAKAATQETMSSSSLELNLEPKGWEFDDAEVEVMLAPPSQWPYEMLQEKTKLLPSQKVLRSRLQATLAYPEIADPLVIRLKSNDARRLLKQLGNKEALAAMNSTSARPFLEKFTQGLRKRVNESKLSLAAEDLNWIDLEKLSKTVSQTSTEPLMSRAVWAKIKNDASVAQYAESHFGAKWPRISKKVERWIAQGNTGDIPLTLFLPDHLEDEYGNFSPYRGRNCFATALSFADKKVVSRSHINPVREPQHDRWMINADEFANALWLGYYELDGQEIVEGLKLGDVVVFYDEAEEGYRSLRHTAVHIADTIYFHKQSKSATTPLEFVDWSKLVSTWSGIAKKLEYKVYRKLPMGVSRYQKPAAAFEKVYWSH